MPIRWILGLYPRAWRRRYDEEMMALLEQHAVTWRTWIDLLLGAIDARSDPYFTAPPGMAPEGWALRRAHRTILITFPLLVLGHFFFLDELDDVFSAWNRAHTSLWRFKGIADILTYTGFAAFFVTGLVLAVLLARQALEQTPKRSRPLLYGGLAAAVALCGVCSIVPAVIPGLLLVSMTVVPFSIAIAISRSEISPKALGFALAADALTVVGMAAQALFIAVWGMAIWNNSTVQQMSQAADRHLWPGEGWRLQLAGGLAWMTLMTVVAIGGWGRGVTGFKTNRFIHNA